LKVTER